MDKEIRAFTLDSVEIEDRAEGKAPLIRGHAAVFDKLSENLGGFREKIAPGAFSDVLTNDVRALVNHDPSQILGRTTSETLRIKQDETGLQYEVDVPDTQAGRDLIVSMKRGDINQSSFGFTVGKDSWTEDSNGFPIRTIEKVDRLLDVSPVTYPAYPDATVGLRNLETFKKEKKEDQDNSVEIYKMKTHLKTV